MSASHPTPGPLAGLRVLDFTQFLAGPYATMILGDLGAEVIKVETPAGELARHLPPHFVDGDSLYYHAVNRNKRSLALDLKTAAAKTIVRDLMGKVDVVVENFRPGVMARLGFDPAVQRRARPDLIWCSISGFGQDGPARDLPAYDMIVQALSGGMSLTGAPDGVNVRAGIPLGDLSAGMFGVIGILSALHERARTGNGRTVDVSMLDCQISMLTYQASYYLHSGVVPGRQGRGHDSIPTYRAFTAGDGRDFVVTANTEEMWVGLCRALGAPHLAQDPRFITNADRHQNRDALEPILSDLFLGGTVEEWIQRLQVENVPVGEVRTLDRALADEQVRHRNMVLTIEDQFRPPVQAAGNPVKFAGHADAPARYPPRLGADSVATLEDLLDLPKEAIDQLIKAGAVYDEAAVARRSAGR